MAPSSGGWRIALTASTADRSRMAVLRTAVVADDDPLLRAMLVRLVEGGCALRVIGEASDGARAVALVREHRPAVALLDVRMPRLDGLAACRLVQELGTRVVLLCNDLDDWLIDAAREAGAAACVPKATGADALCAAVARVAGGGEAFSW